MKIILAIFIMFFTACVNKEMNKIENLSYKIISLNIDNKDIYLKNEPLTLTFDNSFIRIGGYAGCNNYFGETKIQGEQISLKTLGITRKMCSGAEMEIESIMINKILNNSYIWKIKNKKLFLESKAIYLVLEAL